MAVSLETLRSDVNAIKSELDFISRSKREEASLVISRLREMSDEDFEYIVGLSPEFRILRDVTLEDLMQNTNNVRDLYRRVYSELTVDAYERLKEIKAKLCLT